LKKGQSAFWRKGDIMVQVWNDKRLVQMISMVHDAAIVNTGRKDRKTNLEIKKPYSGVQYGKFMESIGRTDQYLSFYLILRKTVKWLKKVVLYLLSTALFNAFFCVQNTKYKQKIKCKNFLHIGKVLDIKSPE
jgi:hypothetical protein